MVICQRGPGPVGRLMPIHRARPGPGRRVRSAVPGPGSRQPSVRAVQRDDQSRDLAPAVGSEQAVQCVYPGQPGGGNERGDCLGRPPAQCCQRGAARCHVRVRIAGLQQAELPPGPGALSMPDGERAEHVHQCVDHARVVDEPLARRWVTEQIAQCRRDFLRPGRLHRRVGAARVQQDRYVHPPHAPFPRRHVGRPDRVVQAPVHHAAQQAAHAGLVLGGCLHGQAGDEHVGHPTRTCPIALL